MSEIEFAVLLVIMVLIAVIAYLTYINTKLAKDLKSMIPPEALSFTGGVVNSVLTSLDSYVQKTPNKLDDGAFLILASQLGYEVIKKPDDNTGEAISTARDPSRAAFG